MQGSRYRDIFTALDDAGYSPDPPEARLRLREPMTRSEPIARAAPDLEPTRIADYLSADDLPNTTHEEIEGPETENPGERKVSGDVPGRSGMSGHRRTQIAAGITQALAGLLQLGGAATGRFGMEAAGMGIGGLAGGVAEGAGARVAEEQAAKQRLRGEARQDERNLVTDKRAARGEEHELERLAIEDARAKEALGESEYRYGAQQKRQEMLDSQELADQQVARRLEADRIAALREQIAAKNARSASHGGGGRPVAAPDGTVTVAGHAYPPAELDQMAQGVADRGDTAIPLEVRLPHGRAFVEQQLYLAQASQREHPAQAAEILAKLHEVGGLHAGRGAASGLTTGTTRTVRANPLERVGWTVPPGSILTPAHVAEAGEKYTTALGLAQDLRRAAALARRMTPQEMQRAATQTYTDPNGPEAQYFALINNIQAEYRQNRGWGTPQAAELTLLNQYFPEAGVSWRNMTGAAAANMMAMAGHVMHRAGANLEGAGFAPPPPRQRGPVAQP